MKDKIKNTEGTADKNAAMNTITVHGEVYSTTLTKKYMNRKKWVRHDEKLLYSYIPGTITEVYGKEGQLIKKGEKLLLLEAMKMLNSITVPVSGKIKKINVKVGDKIPKGFLMVEFD
jgi:biotin carboxyl carrier protein